MNQERIALNHVEQSAIWARFQESVSYRGKAYKLGKYFIYKHILPKGFSWLECPRGKISRLNLKKLKQIAKKERAIFLRVAPQQGYNFPKRFKKAHASHHPETTLVLDLSLSKEKLLEQMKPKGRYNIRLAEKKGIKIEQSNKINTFYELLEKTTERDDFASHPKEYYEKLLKTLSGKNRKKGFAKLFLATHENAPLAAIIVTFYKNTATYYFGASGGKHRNLMAPYLLQWEAVKYAKKIGCHYYDFLGISPAKAKNHAWQGVTEFKKKFGGKTLTYKKEREFVFRPFLYRALILVKKLRRFSRFFRR